MKISYATNYKHYALLGDTLGESLETIKEIGFGAICPDEVGFLPEERQKYIHDIKVESGRQGIHLSYLHLPYVVDAHSDVFLGEEFFSKTLDVINMAVEMGIKDVVVHPFTPFKYQFYSNAQKFDYEGIREFCEEVNFTFFRRLQPYLLKAGLRCAIENMYTTDEDFREQMPSCCCTAEEWIKYIDTLGEPYCACFDLGHANLVLRDNEKILQLVRNMGSRIKVLHINDNYAKWFKIGDWHQLPGVGDTDLIGFAKALKEVGFDGDLNFEVMVTTRNRDICIAQLKYIKAIGDVMIKESGLS